jgi:hypothetical protein
MGNGGESPRIITEYFDIAVMFLTRIRYVFGSNLGRGTGQFGLKLSRLPSVPPDKFLGSASVTPRPLPFRSFPVVIHFSSQHLAQHRHKAHITFSRAVYIQNESICLNCIPVKQQIITSCERSGTWHVTLVVSFLFQNFEAWERVRTKPTAWFISFIHGNYSGPEQCSLTPDVQEHNLLIDSDKFFWTTVENAKKNRFTISSKVV